MQYGGWYNNPATGRNQRWFNGVWTNGEEPNQQSSNSGLTGDSTYDAVYQGFAPEVDKYINELIDRAQGDYDYAAKWIEAEYKRAVGTDDEGRKSFLKTVANDLEAKVGRIVYDYDTNKYRHEEDVKLATDRVTDTRDLALKRLAEDEKVLKAQTEQQNQINRETQGSTLNERGILSSTRENATGLAGKEVGMLEQDIRDRMSALERANLREKEDITTTADQKLKDIGLFNNRTLDDLQTGARRGIEDAESVKLQDTELAKRKLERLKAEAEGEKRSSMNSLKKYANYYALGTK